MLTVLLTSIVSSSFLATGPTPGIELKKLQFNGRGCTPGNFRVVPTPDYPNRFSFEVADMYAEWAPGIPLSSSRSNCVVTLDYIVPDGWQLAIAHVGMRGVTSLTSEVSALLSARIFFPGQTSPTLNFEKVISGPQNYQDIVIDHYPETPTWSQCGGAQSLAINWAVRIKPPVQPSPTGSGSFEFFYDMSEPEQVIDIIWQPC